MLLVSLVAVAASGFSRSQTFCAPNAGDYTFKIDTCEYSSEASWSLQVGQHVYKTGTGAGTVVVPFQGIDFDNYFTNAPTKAPTRAPTLEPTISGTNSMQPTTTTKAFTLNMYDKSGNGWRDIVKLEIDFQASEVRRQDTCRGIRHTHK